MALVAFAFPLVSWWSLVHVPREICRSNTSLTPSSTGSTGPGGCCHVRRPVRTANKWHSVLTSHSYEHVNSVKLSLPLSSALTFLTILLPLLAAGNTFLLPYLTRKPSPSSKSTSLALLTSPRSIQILQVLQGIATTILATLYFQDVVPSQVRDCELSTRWQHLFRAKDVLSIKTIQDALECCGFRSVRDMAWPFPPAEVQCAARFDRGLACQDPWTRALQSSAGVNLGVVLVVGLLQVRNKYFCSVI